MEEQVSKKQKTSDTGCEPFDETVPIVQLSDRSFADIILWFNGYAFAAHIAILSEYSNMLSDVFKSTTQDCMTSYDGRQVPVLSLRNFDPPQDVATALLHAMYSRCEFVDALPGRYIGPAILFSNAIACTEAINRKLRSVYHAHIDKIIGRFKGMSGPYEKLDDRPRFIRCMWSDATLVLNDVCDTTIVSYIDKSQLKLLIKYMRMFFEKTRLSALVNDIGIMDQAIADSFNLRAALMYTSIYYVY